MVKEVIDSNRWLVYKFGDHSITGVPPIATRRYQEWITNTCLSNLEQYMVVIGCSYLRPEMLQKADSARHISKTSQNRDYVGRKQALESLDGTLHPFRGIWRPELVYLYLPITNPTMVVSVNDSTNCSAAIKRNNSF